MKGWAFIFALIIAFAFGLCLLSPPVSAVDLVGTSEPIPGSMVVYEFGVDGSMLADSSVSSSIDHDPEAPPRESEPAEGGQDVSEADFRTMGEEAVLVESEPAEGGQDVSEADFRTMGEEAVLVEPESAAGGQDVSESDFRTMGEEAVLVEPESAEGGQDVSEEDSSLMGEEVSAQEEEPAEGGQDVSEATSTDLSAVVERLDTINSLLVFILASLWAIAGLFFAFKLGGALL